MKVSEVMTRGVSSCRIDASAGEAARVMWDRDCGFVPVTDESGRLRSVVTDRDLLMAAQMQGKNLSELRLSALPPKPLRTCRAEDDVPTALETMAQQQVRRLPVVDRNDRLVGVLSLNDVAIRALDDEKHMRHVASTLAAISRHREATPPSA